MKEREVTISLLDNKQCEFQASTGGPRVFLAEDDRELRELIALSLAQAGYKVVAVENAGKLMDLLASCMTQDGLFNVDAIITDIRMPGTTGLRALAMLREYDRMTPVVMITAFGGQATHTEALRLGATMVLDKPFDLDDLCGAVRQLVPLSA